MSTIEDTEESAARGWLAFLTRLENLAYIESGYDTEEVEQVEFHWSDSEHENEPESPVRPPVDWSISAAERNRRAHAENGNRDGDHPPVDPVVADTRDHAMVRFQNQVTKAWCSFIKDRESVPVYDRAVLEYADEPSSTTVLMTTSDVARASVGAVGSALSKFAGPVSVGLKSAASSGVAVGASSWLLAKTTVGTVATAGQNLASDITSLAPSLFSERAACAAGIYIGVFTGTYLALQFAPLLYTNPSYLASAASGAYALKACAAFHLGKELTGSLLQPDYLRVTGYHPLRLAQQRLRSHERSSQQDIVVPKSKFLPQELYSNVWSVSSKMRNKLAHALNGNTSSVSRSEKNSQHHC
jgi:hypothetical protein